MSLVPLVKQVGLHENTPRFGGIRVAQSLVSYVVFCFCVLSFRCFSFCHGIFCQLLVYKIEYSFGIFRIYFESYNIEMGDTNVLIFSHVGRCIAIINRSCVVHVLILPPFYNSFIGHNGGKSTHKINENWYSRIESISLL